MAVFDFVRVTFTPAEWDKVGREVNGRRFGGAQRLLARILQKTNRETLSVELSPKEQTTCRQYSAYRGGGGFEQRFACIVDAIERETKGIDEESMPSL